IPAATHLLYSLRHRQDNQSRIPVENSSRRRKTRNPGGRESDQLAATSDSTAREYWIGFRMYSFRLNRPSLFPRAVQTSAAPVGCSQSTSRLILLRRFPNPLLLFLQFRSEGF